MSSSNRTEQATPRRLERARKEGNFVASRELVAAAQYLVFLGLVFWVGESGITRVAELTRGLLRQAFTLQDISTRQLAEVAWKRLGPEAAAWLLAGLLLPLAMLCAQLAVSRLGIAGKKLAPDLARLNPAQRIKRMPAENTSQFLRSAALLPLLLGVAAWMALRHADLFAALPMRHWAAGVDATGQVFRDLLEKSALLFAVLGGLDWWRQQRKYAKQLRMTKQEVREEHKEVEGNPQVKAKVRKLQRDLSRRRMMADVPKASAVIVNPTHYAVAIRYELGTGSAPKVVAKGRNHVARRIREMAIASEVPIVENPPLARALFSAAEVGQEIPPHLYRAVAEILAYLYRILGQRAGGPRPA